jgi:hypothetical protein
MHLGELLLLEEVGVPEEVLSKAEHSGSHVI